MTGLRVLAIAIGLVGIAAPAFADTTRGGCEPSKVRYISDDLPHSTKSMSYVKVPGALLRFTQGGSKPGCVIVNFSAQASTDAGNEMDVRATLDGEASAVPAAIKFTFNSVIAQARAANFVFQNVAPGQHEVRMEFLSDCSTCFVTMENSTTIVSYTP